MSTIEKRFFARGSIYNLAEMLAKFTSKTMPRDILRSLLENLNLDEKIYSSHGIEIVRVNDVDVSPRGVFVKIDTAGNVQSYPGRRGDPLENAPGADRLFFIDADGSVQLVRDGSIKVDMLLIPAPDARLREDKGEETPCADPCPYPPRVLPYDQATRVRGLKETVDRQSEKIRIYRQALMAVRSATAGRNDYASPDEICNFVRDVLEDPGKYIEIRKAGGYLRIRP